MRSILLTLVAAFVAGSLSPTPTSAQTPPGTRFLRQPDASADHVAFVHANDVWIVGREGGMARRLTSDDGAETSPAISPDGQWVAFSGEYGGNQDVYLVPIDGGQPQRLTWHPGGDEVQGWTPDGRVLFRSSRDGAPRPGPEPARPRRAGTARRCRCGRGRRRQAHPAPAAGRAIGG